MQYKTTILALLSASGALAAPKGISSRSMTDNTVRVILSNQATETGAQNAFQGGVRQYQAPATSGPFQTIEIEVGKDVQNQEYRCQALDEAGKPIIAVRGTNTDITFSDADKGPWTFREPAEVSEVVCDPTFVKIGSDALEIRVVLSNQATETGSQTVFTAGSRQEKPPVGSKGPFETVELRVGELVDPAQRCQILDNAGNPITVLRGANVDVTFSDADKGEWTFQQDSEVSSIICDPEFVAASK